MSVYATNNYDLKIPVDQVETIVDALNQVYLKTYPEWATKAPSPETLVTMIAGFHGSENSDDWAIEDFTIEVEEDPVLRTIPVIHFQGESFGKVSRNLRLFEQILATHEVTGIVWGECEGEYFLSEYMGTKVISHRGEVVFPTYNGELYP